MSVLENTHTDVGAREYSHFHGLGIVAGRELIASAGASRAVKRGRAPAARVVHALAIGAGGSVRVRRNRGRTGGDVGDVARVAAWGHRGELPRVTAQIQLDQASLVESCASRVG